jgi:hypothetical protein
MGASIVVLLFAGSPTQIPRLIPPIVLDSIKRVAQRRACSNVLEEGGEVIHPSFINPDSASTVV